MKLNTFAFAGILGVAQAWAGQVPPATEVQSDPFYLPPEAHAFALRITRTQETTPEKLKALLRAIFQPRGDGGLGMTYDNSRTRTVEEVWRDGKANCLSLTSFFVMCCRSLGIREQYAEALNTNHWRKVGSIVHFERHVVALTPEPSLSDLVADFVPDLRKRTGTYVVAVLPEPRFRALFYSNRAVEALSDGDLESARALAQISLQSDPKSSVGWNILGVAHVALGNPAKAEEAYLKAMELDPRDGAPIGNMENLLREAGRLEEAVKYRQRGESVRKKDPFFHAYLAEEALLRGDFAEAGLRIHAALKILPKDPDFLLMQARVKLGEGDLEGAMKDIRNAQLLAEPAERERYDGKLAYIQGMKADKVP